MTFSIVFPIYFELENTLDNYRRLGRTIEEWLDRAASNHSVLDCASGRNFALCASFVKKCVNLRSYFIGQ